MPEKVLIVDDEPSWRRSIHALLEQDYPDITIAKDAGETLRKARKGNFQIAIVDVQLPDMDGLTLLERLKDEFPLMPVIMVTGKRKTFPDIVEAITKGAVDYIDKDFIDVNLLFSVRNALEKSLLKSRVQLSEEAADRKYKIIGKSQKLQECILWVNKVAKADTPVLLTGETGTGKECIAHLIHRESNRKKEAFIAVNCAAVNVNLLESEFFGHEKGAFTGAMREKRGKFERAHLGTLFLDEVGEIPIELQAKLLRVLQEHSFERVGGESLIQTDFKLIAATNRDLQQEVKAGKFREDLFYRLNVFPIHLPPLRERIEDIHSLIDYFVEQSCGEIGKTMLKISQEARDALADYEWPGNIRELKNIIERAVILAEGPKIEKRDIAVFPGATLDESELFYDRKHSLEEMQSAWENKIISRAINDNNGDVQGAAGQLKIASSTLYSKINRFKIQH